jgi:hypothetical protein
MATCAPASTPTGGREVIERPQGEPPLPRRRQIPPSANCRSSNASRIDETRAPSPIRSPLLDRYYRICVLPVVAAACVLHADGEAQGAAVPACASAEQCAAGARRHSITAARLPTLSATATLPERQRKRHKAFSDDEKLLPIFHRATISNRIRPMRENATVIEDDKTNKQIRREGPPHTPRDAG